MFYTQGNINSFTQSNCLNAKSKQKNFNNYFVFNFVVYFLNSYIFLKIILFFFNQVCFPSKLKIFFFFYKSLLQIFSLLSKSFYSQFIYRNLTFLSQHFEITYNKQHKKNNNKKKLYLLMPNLFPKQKCDQNWLRSCYQINKHMKQTHFSLLIDLKELID